MINRRAFLPMASAFLYSSAGPLHAQTPGRKYKIGLFNRGAPITDRSPYGSALVRGLAKRGYELGKTVELESRGANGKFELLPQLFDELVATKLDVVVTVGYPAALVAKTRGNIPIVSYSTGDPVATGLVTSLARPGGHLTGISDMADELSAKRLQLLKEMVPGLKRIAIVWNTADDGMVHRFGISRSAAKSLGLDVQPLGVREPGDLDRGFGAMTQDKPDAVLVIAEALTISNRRRIFDFGKSQHIPVLFDENGFLIRDGGLMYYGPDNDECFDRVAALVDRILRGAKPEELPFEQPTTSLISLYESPSISLNTMTAR